MNELKSKLWYLINEWTVCKCPYNKNITRANRKSLIKQMFNF